MRISRADFSLVSKSPGFVGPELAVWSLIVKCNIFIKVGVESMAFFVTGILWKAMPAIGINKFCDLSGPLKEKTRMVSLDLLQHLAVLCQRSIQRQQHNAALGGTPAILFLDYLAPCTDSH